MEGAKSASSSIKSPASQTERSRSRASPILSTPLSSASSRFTSSALSPMASSMLFTGSMDSSLRAAAMASSSVPAAICVMPERAEACAPASASISICLPAAAETTIGPLTNSWPFLLIIVTSVIPASAEAMPPQGPSTSEI